MKVALLCASLLVVSLTACTTLENRRDLNCGYGHVNGPYSSGKFRQKQEVKITAASDGKTVTK